jgi:anti-sigma B factor antagonist
MALEVKQREHAGTCIIQAEGEIDLYSSPALRETLLKAIPNAAKKVCVDLSGVAYMDSSGVATLVEGLKAATKASIAFALAAPSPPVMRVLELSRLNTVFTIQESPETL